MIANNLTFATQSSFARACKESYADIYLRTQYLLFKVAVAFAEVS